MRDASLRRLNFQDVLRYEGLGEQPQPSTWHGIPINYVGFCTACDEQGIFEGADETLALMSHGADDDDYRQVLGNNITGCDDRGRDKGPRVMMLLESPGANWAGTQPDGQRVFAWQARQCNGFRKLLPVHHYYWIPELGAWPEHNQPAALPDFYGSYFVFLVREFCLEEVYVTNVVKCSKATRSDPCGERLLAFATSNPRDARVIDTCTKKFLTREIAIWDPDLIFVFGCRAWKMSAHLMTRWLKKLLLHPKTRRSRRAIADENNRRVREALTEWRARAALPW